MDDDDDDLKPERWTFLPGDTLGGHRVVVDDRDREVVLVLSLGPDDEDAARRGRLVAAAPDLVAALKAGLAPNALNCGFGGQADDPGLCCCGRPKAYHWKAMAREALTKATGGRS